jgi:hypothetical protein
VHRDPMTRSRIKNENAALAALLSIPACQIPGPYEAAAPYSTAPLLMIEARRYAARISSSETKPTRCRASARCTTGRKGASRINRSAKSSD